MSLSAAHQTVALHYNEKYYTDHLSPHLHAAVVQRTHAVARYVGEDDAVLDFGCSDGSILEALPGRRKAGVEINAFSRSIATRRGLDVRSSIDDFAGEKFDCIVSCHCLEHVVDPCVTLTKLRGLLHAQGVVVLNLPMNDCRDRTHREWRPGDVNQHLYAWTPLTLGNLLLAAGFEPVVVRIHPYTYPSRFITPFAASYPKLYHWIARIYTLIRPRLQLVAVAKPAARC